MYSSDSVKVPTWQHNHCTLYEKLNCTYIFDWFLLMIYWNDITIHNILEENGGLKKYLFKHLPYSVWLGFGLENYYLKGGGYRLF